MVRPALLLVCVWLVPACSTDQRPELPVRAGQVPALTLVLDGAGAPLGVGAILRTTARSAVLLVSPCPARDLPGEVVVAFGAERLTVGRPADAPRVGDPDRSGPTILELPRGAHDLRPIGPAAIPAAGDVVRVVAPGLGALLVQATTVEDVAQNEVRLAALPPAGPGDRRAPAERAAAMCGAAVLTTDGALLGFVTSADGERPAVTPLGAFAGLLEAVSERAGPDVLAPDDEALTFEVRVAKAEGLPTIADEWGAPDFAVLVTLGDQPAQHVQLWEEEPPPLLLRARQPGPVSVRLVERDVTLGAGETFVELSEPVPFEALLPGETTITFPLSTSVLERHPEARRGPRRARITLRVTVVDPEARSGTDRTPLGAVAYDLGRVASGRLDLPGGDGSDVVAVDGPRDGPTSVVAVLLRREPGARVTARAFPPGFEAALFDLAPGPDRWLAVTRATLPAGRTFVRVSSVEGPASAYHLLVARSDDPQGLVRSLFRMVARVAADRLPYLQSRAFASEVAVGLTFGAALDPHVVSGAVLSELGHRTAEVRHLALNLLEAHFPPAPAALDDVYRTAVDAPRALDAGLLLAAQRPNEARTDEVVARAVRDPDPLIKLRALDIALQVEEPDRRERLTRALADSDPTAVVHKALARADLGP